MYLPLGYEKPLAGARGLWVRRRLFLWIPEVAQHRLYFGRFRLSWDHPEVAVLISLQLGVIGLILGVLGFILGIIDCPKVK